MSVTITVSDQVAQMLDELAYEDAHHVDAKLKNLLVTEYQRRLARYKRLDRQMVAKYGLDFAEFERTQVTKQKGYSWEVEQDAMAWETAVDGMEMIETYLQNVANHAD